MSSRRGLSITRGTVKRPVGQPLIRKRGGKVPDTCMLGGLSNNNWVCGGKVVKTIKNIGICATHHRRLMKIKKASDKKHNHNGCKPQTQVFRRANAA